MGASPHGPQEGKKKTTTAVQRYALDVYDALAANAEKEDKLLVFRGTVGAVYSGLGISQSYYSPIFNLLEYNECIERVARGARGAESIIVLLKRPKDAHSLELPAKDEKVPEDLTNDPEFVKLKQRVEALETITGGLDIVGVLKNFEDRLTAQEKKRGAVNGKKS